MQDGAIFAGSTSFYINIIGRGGHAAAPHQAIDPVVAGTAIVQALQMLVSRETDPVDSAVISVTRFNTGEKLQQPALSLIFSFFSNERKFQTSEIVEQVLNCLQACFMERLMYHSRTPHVIFWAAAWVWGLIFNGRPSRAFCTDLNCTWANQTQSRFHIDWVFCSIWDTCVENFLEHADLRHHLIVLLTQRYSKF